MPLFAFSAKSRSGERIDGTLDATDRRGNRDGILDQVEGRHAGGVVVFGKPGEDGDARVEIGAVWAERHETRKIETLFVRPEWRGEQRGRALGTRRKPGEAIEHRIGERARAQGGRRGHGSEWSLAARRLTPASRS